MKILITTDWYSPAVNGVVTSVLNLRRELEALGNEVRVLTLSQSPRSFCRDGVTYVGSVDAGLFYPGARLRTALAGKWVREVCAWGPDIIHSQCEFSTFFLARHIARELNIPQVHTYHTVYENYTHYFSPSVRWGRRAVMAFSRWIAARTDCMIAPTEKTARLLKGYEVPCPVEVIPTGIDLSRFTSPAPGEDSAALKRTLGIPAENLLLVYVGRLAEEKNIGELIDCLASLRGRPVTLLLVGDGPCREELESRRDELGLRGQVVFAGMAGPDTVAAFYRLGDLFVSASTSETQGLTYIEALSSGLPALCRADSCLENVVRDGENGWQYRTKAEFLEKLRWFAGHPEARAAMGAAALSSARPYSARNFALRVEAVYRRQVWLRGAREGVPA